MGIKKILGGKTLKSKKCLKCGFEARLEEGKSIDELARTAQKEPHLSISVEDMSHLIMGGTKGRKKGRKRILSASELVRLTGSIAATSYDEQDYDEMKVCPHCEVLLEAIPKGK